MSTTKQTPEQREESRRRISREMGKTLKEFEVPTPQPWYHYTNDTWTSSAPTPSTSTTTTTTTTIIKSPKIRITTWNIDANAPAFKERMAVALSHLSDLHNSEDLPSIIFLQEMLDTDIEQIKAAPWVRERFFITDVEGNKSAMFGTTMLVDKRLDVRRVFRVLYDRSCMQRDGLFVDVGIGEDRVLRLCNTHLESMAYTARRFAQLQLASSYLHGSGTLPSSSNTTEPKTINHPIPHASILAGDLNANSPEDRPLPAANNLRDAFLVLGGQEDTDESYTWGQQAAAHLREEFGCSRMDKLLFCGGVEVESLRRVGERVEAWVEYPKWSDDEDEDEDEETGENVWVSDHLGLEGVFRLV